MDYRNRESRAPLIATFTLGQQHWPGELSLKSQKASTPRLNNLKERLQLWHATRRQAAVRLSDREKSPALCAE